MENHTALRIYTQSGPRILKDIYLTNRNLRSFQDPRLPLQCSSHYTYVWPSNVVKLTEGATAYTARKHPEKQLDM